MGGHPRRLHQVARNESADRNLTQLGHNGASGALSSSSEGRFAEGEGRNGELSRTHRRAKLAESSAASVVQQQQAFRVSAGLQVSSQHSKQSPRTCYTCHNQGFGAYFVVISYSMYVKNCKERHQFV